MIFNFATEPQNPYDLYACIQYASILCARILYVTSKYDISITGKQVNLFTCLLVYLFTSQLVSA